MKKENKPQFNSTDLFLILVLVLLQHLTVYFSTSRFAGYGSLAVLLVAGLSRRKAPLGLSILYCLTYLVGPKVIPEGAYQIPGISYLVPAIFTLPVFVFLKTDGKIKQWFRRSRSNKSDLILMAATIVFSSAALILWARAFGQFGDIAAVFSSLANFPAWLVLLLIVPMMAMINALAEETFFRGFVQDSLEASTSNRVTVLVVQAIAFASIHYMGGFPNGKIGYLMTFVYGLLLGLLRMRTQSLRMSWATHVLADITIFCLVVRLT